MGIETVDDYDAIYNAELGELKNHIDTFLGKFWGEKCPSYTSNCLLCSIYEAYEDFIGIVDCAFVDRHFNPKDEERGGGMMGVFQQLYGGNEETLL